MEKQQSLRNWKLPRGQVFWFLAVLTGSALILRFMIGYTTVHYFDLSFYVDWSNGAAEDIFGAYNHITNLDYPPLFLFPLYLTGKLMDSAQISGFDGYAMLALKGWQMLFDIAVIPLLYVALRRQGDLFALACAALWAVNPTVIYNSSYWGQTDCIMIFLLVLAFHLLTTGRPVWAGFVITLACLMKFQSLYFVPVFALALLTTYPLRKVLRSAAAGLLTAGAVFFPFCLRSGWKLPLEVYFGGFKQYPGASLNAFNLYTAQGMNFFSSYCDLFGPVSAETFSMFMIVLLAAATVFFWFTASERSVWLSAFLFMQTIFLFTTRMHERYQIPALVFALAACVVHRSGTMLASYFLLTVMTFLNHFLVIEEVFQGNNKEAWALRFDQIAQTLSWTNLLLYLFTLAVVLHIYYRNGYRSFRQGVRALFPARRPGRKENS